MSQFGTAVRRAGVSLFVTLAMVTGMTAFSAGAATAAPTTSDRAVVGKSDAGKITSKIYGKTSEGDKVRGTFTPIKAVQKDGVLSIKGFVEGKIKKESGRSVRFSGIETIPVKKINGAAPTDARTANRAAACDILNLVLGPLDLNILGLRVQLNRVVLDITAIPGGGLLGDLLCSVANLLSGGLLGGLLGQLQTLLNQILGALNLGV